MLVHRLRRWPNIKLTLDNAPCLLGRINQCGKVDRTKGEGTGNPCITGVYQHPDEWGGRESLYHWGLPAPWGVRGAGNPCITEDYQHPEEWGGQGIPVSLRTTSTMRSEGGRESLYHWWLPAPWGVRGAGNPCITDDYQHHEGWGGQRIPVSLRSTSTLKSEGGRESLYHWGLPAPWGVRGAGNPCITEDYQHHEEWGGQGIPASLRTTSTMRSERGAGNPCITEDYQHHEEWGGQGIPVSLGTTSTLRSEGGRESLHHWGLPAPWGVRGGRESLYHRGLPAPWGVRGAGNPCITEDYQHHEEWGGQGIPVSLMTTSTLRSEVGRESLYHWGLPAPWGVRGAGNPCITDDYQHPEEWGGQGIPVSLRSTSTMRSEGGRESLYHWWLPAPWGVRGAGNPCITEVYQHHEEWGGQGIPVSLMTTSTLRSEGGRESLYHWGLPAPWGVRGAGNPCITDDYQHPEEWGGQRIPVSLRSTSTMRSEGGRESLYHWWLPAPWVVRGAGNPCITEVYQHHEEWGGQRIPVSLMTTSTLRSEGGRDSLYHWGLPAPWGVRGAGNPCITDDYQHPEEWGGRESLYHWWLPAPWGVRGAGNPCITDDYQHHEEWGGQGIPVSLGTTSTMRSERGAGSPVSLRTTSTLRSEGGRGSLYHWGLPAPWGVRGGQEALFHWGLPAPWGVRGAGNPCITEDYQHPEEWGGQGIPVSPRTTSTLRSEGGGQEIPVSLRTTSTMRSEGGRESLYHWWLPAPWGVRGAGNPCITDDYQHPEEWGRAGNPCITGDYQHPEEWGGQRIPVSLRSTSTMRSEGGRESLYHWWLPAPWVVRGAGNPCITEVYQHHEEWGGQRIPVSLMTTSTLRSEGGRDSLYHWGLPAPWGVRGAGNPCITDDYQHPEEWGGRESLYHWWLPAPWGVRGAGNPCITDDYQHHEEWGGQGIPVSLGTTSTMRSERGAGSPVSLRTTSTLRSEGGRGSLYHWGLPAPWGVRGGQEALFHWGLPAPWGVRGGAGNPCITEDYQHHEEWGGQGIPISLMTTSTLRSEGGRESLYHWWLPAPWGVREGRESLYHWGLPAPWGVRWAGNPCITEDYQHPEEWGGNPCITEDYQHSEEWGGGQGIPVSLMTTSTLRSEGGRESLYHWGLPAPWGVRGQGIPISLMTTSTLRSEGGGRDSLYHWGLPAPWGVRGAGNPYITDDYQHPEEWGGQGIPVSLRTTSTMRSEGGRESLYHWWLPAPWGVRGAGNPCITEDYQHPEEWEGGRKPCFTDDYQHPEEWGGQGIPVTLGTTSTMRSEGGRESLYHWGLPAPWGVRGAGNPCITDDYQHPEEWGGQGIPVSLRTTSTMRSEGGRESLYHWWLPAPWGVRGAGNPCITEDYQHPEEWGGQGIPVSLMTTSTLRSEGGRESLYHWGLPAPWGVRGAGNPCITEDYQHPEEWGGQGIPVSLRTTSTLRSERGAGSPVSLMTTSTLRSEGGRESLYHWGLPAPWEVRGGQEALFHWWLPAPWGVRGAGNPCHTGDYQHWKSKIFLLAVDS